jgi:hypothetical protein
MPVDDCDLTEAVRPSRLACITGLPAPTSSWEPSSLALAGCLSTRTGATSSWEMFYIEVASAATTRSWTDWAAIGRGIPAGVLAKFKESASRGKASIFNAGLWASITYACGKAAKCRGKGGAACSQSPSGALKKWAALGRAPSLPSFVGFEQSPCGPPCSPLFVC